MKRFLEGFLPRILPEGVSFTLIPHEGKSDLEKSIPRKLRAWRAPDARFIIVRDQDSAECTAVKRHLLGLCEDTPHTPLVRIACREMESWFLGDLASVDAVFGTHLARRQQKEKYRDPDHLGSPSRELGRLVPGYGKTGGARALGPVLSIEGNRSISFGYFVQGVRRMAGLSEAHLNA